MKTTKMLSFGRRAKHMWMAKRLAMTSSITDTDVSLDAEWANARPYFEIPGPKPLPIPKFGNSWRMSKYGTYGGLDMIEFHGRLYEEYGPIVRLSGLGRADMVSVYDPQDAEKVFRNESAWPQRALFQSLDYYRRVNRADVFHGNPGILSSQGEEWHQNRTAMNQPMMRPRNVQQYHTPIQTVGSCLIQRIRPLRDRNMEMPKDFVNELHKWALESIALVALDARLGCLDGHLEKDSDAQIMIDSVLKLFHMSFELDMMPSIWKYITTPKWLQFVKVMDNITDITLKHINRKIEEIETRQAEDPQGQSVLEVLLRSAGGKTIGVTMAMDMMLAGVDTTAHSTANALYYLAKNPEAQEKAYREILRLLPNRDDHLPLTYLNDVPYLKACVKESQRLAPMPLFSARAAGRNLVIKGFQIPKGVDILMQNRHMSHSERHYPRPQEFIPERWLKSEKNSPLSTSHTHPFVSLPFGFGPRMCIGRRLAELEMHTILAKMLRNFKISYHHGEMEWLAELLISPKKPLQFRMEDRTE